MIKKRFFLCFLSIFIISAFFSQERKSAGNSSQKTANPKTVPQDLPPKDKKNLLNVKYPQIKDLTPKDELYKEYSRIVEQNYKLIKNLKSPELIFFVYTVKDKKMTLLELAARCNIPYDAIASLNGIEFSAESISGKSLLLPTAPGIFIKREDDDEARNSLEILLHEKYFNSGLERETITCKIDYFNSDQSDFSDAKAFSNTDDSKNARQKEFVFLVNERFSPTIRAYFLDSGLRLPLDKDSYYVSSAFGRRKNPFSGEWKDHNGIDLAADEGTPVYAIKDGYVAYAIKNDPTFGNYVILTHDKGAMTSVYAHLSKICFEQYEYIKKGDIIGFVGQTGMATGPHLHFEIRKGGIPLNPEAELKLQQ